MGVCLCSCEWTSCTHIRARCRRMNGSSGHGCTIERSCQHKHTHTRCALRHAARGHNITTLIFSFHNAHAHSVSRMQSSASESATRTAASQHGTRMHAAAAYVRTLLVRSVRFTRSGREGGHDACCWYGGGRRSRHPWNQAHHEARSQGCKQAGRAESQTQQT